MYVLFVMLYKILYMSMSKDMLFRVQAIIPSYLYCHNIISNDNVN